MRFSVLKSQYNIPHFCLRNIDSLKTISNDLSELIDRKTSVSEEHCKDPDRNHVAKTIQGIPRLPATQPCVQSLVKWEMNRGRNEVGTGYKDRAENSKHHPCNEVSVTHLLDEWTNDIPDTQPSSRTPPIYMLDIPMYNAE